MLCEQKIKALVISALFCCPAISPKAAETRAGASAAGLIAGVSVFGACILGNSRSDKFKAFSSIVGAGTMGVVASTLLYTSIKPDEDKEDNAGDVAIDPTDISEEDAAKSRQLVDQQAEVLNRHLLEDLRISNKSTTSAASIDQFMKRVEFLSKNNWPVESFLAYLEAANWSGLLELMKMKHQFSQKELADTLPAETLALARDLHTWTTAVAQRRIAVLKHYTLERKSLETWRNTFGVSPMHIKLLTDSGGVIDLDFPENTVSAELPEDETPVAVETVESDGVDPVVVEESSEQPDDMSAEVSDVDASESGDVVSGDVSEDIVAADSVVTDE